MEIMLIDSPHAVVQVPSSLVGGGKHDQVTPALPRELSKQNGLLSRRCTGDSKTGHKPV